MSEDVLYLEQAQISAYALFATVTVCVCLFLLDVIVLISTLQIFVLDWLYSLDQEVEMYQRG